MAGTATSPAARMTLPSFIVTAGVAVEQDNAGPGIQQRRGDGAAQAGGGTGDDGDLGRDIHVGLRFNGPGW